MILNIGGLDLAPVGGDFPAVGLDFAVVRGDFLRATDDFQAVTGVLAALVDDFALAGRAAGMRAVFSPA